MQLKFPSPAAINHIPTKEWRAANLLFYIYKVVEQMMNMHIYSKVFSSPDAKVAKTAKVAPVPFDRLMLCWDPAGAVMAIAHPDTARAAAHLMCSDLACSDDWAGMDDDARHDRVIAVVEQMITRDHVRPSAIAKALSACPEFADMSNGALI